MNVISESPDANLLSEENHALDNDDEYSDWNGFSSDAKFANDASTNFLAYFEEQKRENPRFILETSSLESSQSFIDALKYQPNEKNSVERDNSSESSFELPSHIFIKKFNEKNYINIDNVNEFSFEMPPRLSIND